MLTDKQIRRRNMISKLLLIGIASYLTGWLTVKVAIAISQNQPPTTEQR